MSDTLQLLPRPPGREALVAVDLCDLSTLWSRDPELASQVLDLYEPLSQTLREDHGGRALPVAGDRELLSFPSVDSALVWALRMQEALLASDWPGALAAAVPASTTYGQELVTGGLRAAMSLHFGCPLEDVNTVLAMVSLAHPGQVLTNEQTWAMATMPGRARELAVKDLEAMDLLLGQAPTRLVQILPRSLGRRRFPPLKRPGRSRISPASDVFVGRTADLEALAERFDAGGRLVSVVGSGGLGKSRLALQHARTTQENWPGGVWVCALEHTTTRTDLLVTMAEAIGATKGRADVDPLDHLAQAVRGLGEALVVLDGFDAHVETATETLGHWVRSAPKVRFLVTARAALELEWETRLSLTPMPDAEIHTLLAARVRAGLRGTERSATNTETLKPLLKRCAGTPLAAELVAAEVIAHGTGPTLELLEPLPDGPDPAAQVAAAAWSTWSITAQQVITAAAIYPGAIGLGGIAAAVLGAAGADAPVADTLADLRVRGILQTCPTGPPGRLRVSSAVAAQAPTSNPPLETHLATWACQTAQASEPSWAWQELCALSHLFGRWREEDPALAVQIALAMEPALVETGWAAMHHDLLDAAVTLSKTTPEIAPRVRAARASAHWAAGRWDAAQADFDELLATELAEDDRVRALQGLGELHWAQDAHEEACAAWEEARTILAESSEPDPGLLTLLAQGLRAQGEVEEASEAADAAVEAAETAGRTEAAGRARTIRGRLHLDAGEIDQAARVLEPALAAAMDARDRRQAALIRGHLAEVALLQGRPETALRMYEQSAQALAQAGHRAMLAQVHATIGAIQLTAEHLEEAMDSLNQALPTCRELGRGDIEATVLAHMGIVSRSQGDIDGALDAFAGAIALARGQDNPSLEGFVLAHRAAVEAAWDRLDVADQMLTEARSRLEESGDTMYQVILDVLGGFADLARARDAAASGDQEQETAHVHLALNRLARGTSHESRVTPPRGGETPLRLGDLRVALRLLDSALASLSPSELPPS